MTLTSGRSSFTALVIDAQAVMPPVKAEGFDSAHALICRIAGREVLTLGLDGTVTVTGSQEDLAAVAAVFVSTFASAFTSAP